MAVSDDLGRPWQVSTFHDLVDLASHPCGMLSDGVLPVFAKLSVGVNAADQLDAELFGLRTVRERAGVLTPQPIAVLPGAAGAVIVMRAAHAVARGPAQWRDIGRALAQLHSVSGERPGFERRGYFGSIVQDNRPLPDWPEFYAERRLWPRLIMAIDNGQIPMEVARKVERVIQRLPELCGPAVTPVLLHGDAQQNNFISTAEGALVIDPAVHYGHPELDLAYLGYFQEVPGDVFDGYRELRAIDPGYSSRRDLWRLSGLLAVVALARVDYLPALIAAVDQYQ